jgi:hypothetical protein
MNRMLAASNTLLLIGYSKVAASRALSIMSPEYFFNVLKTDARRQPGER